MRACARTVEGYGSWIVNFVSKFSFKKTVLKVNQNKNVYYFIVFVHQHTHGQSKKWDANIL